jgi:hypothetical protein
MTGKTTGALARRLARLERRAGKVSWGYEAFKVAVPKIGEERISFLEMLTDEDLTRIMFTRRSEVTLSAQETEVTDELTINLLDHGGVA